MENSKIKRLIFAASISAICFAANFIWYYRSENKANEISREEKPVAYVAKTVDEIHRRPVNRLIWQAIQTGDPLYTEEAIRTSKGGEVRIQFADSNSYLDLEADSLIVIQKSKGEISLDLMEGSVFVDTAAITPPANDGKAPVPAPALTLKSKEGKVDLSKAKVSLSKTQKGLDLQVLEGSAVLKDDSGAAKKEITMGKSLNANNLSVEILSPSMGKPFYLNPESPIPVLFKWQGGPSGTYEIYLGENRKSMSPYLTSVSGANKEMRIPLQPGKHFWKIVLKEGPQGRVIGETPAYRLEVLAQYPPIIIYPDANAVIPQKTIGNELNIKWSLSENLSGSSLELARDPMLKNIIVSKNMGEATTFKLSPASPGDYYWRLTGYERGTNKPIQSKVNHFKIGEEVKVAEVPPPPPPPLPPKIPPKMVWTIPDKPQFYMDKPQLNLAWAIDKTEEIQSYRIRLAPEGQDIASAPAVETTRVSAAMPIKKAGRYIASIEALDKNQQVIASLSPKTYQVAPVPPIKAPEFMPSEGVFEARSDGTADISWSAVLGAREYWFRLVSKAGKEVMKSKYTSTVIQLANLMPGEYNIEVYAVDSNGRESDKKPARTLVVPESSGVQAPKLKKIKVK